MQVRNRVKEFLPAVATDKVRLHPKNHRRHSEDQKGAFREVLDKVGVAGAGLAYYSEKYGGLTLIDGHMRRDELGTMPLVVLDVNDDEAELLLATYDRIGLMAQEDPEALKVLLDSIDFEGADFLSREFDEDRYVSQMDEIADDGSKKEAELARYPIVPDVDEGYDYVLIFCRKQTHHAHLRTMLNIPIQRTPPRRSKGVGVGRAIPYEQFMDFVNGLKRGKEIALPPEEVEELTPDDLPVLDWSGDSSNGER